MRILISLIFTSSFLWSFGQHKTSDNSRDLEKQTLFGIQVSPIIPSNFPAKTNFNFQSDTVNYSISNRLSASYGVEIRHYFTYKFAINTGILYTKRNIIVNYESQHTKTNNAFTDTSFSRDLKFVAFEIPLKLSGYVRLSKTIYMSINGGINLNFYPSDIRVDNVYMQRIGTFGWMFFQAGFSADLGWEYRTEDNGIFYLGLSYQSRVDNMASILFFEKETIHKANYYHNITGNYFAITLKYFFPIK